MLGTHRRVLTGILCLCLLAAVPALGAEGLGAGGAGPDRYHQILKHVRDSEYHFARAWDGSITAPNRVQGLRSYITSDGLRLVPRDPARGDWTLGLTFEGVGRGDDLARSGERTVRAVADSVRVSIDGGQVSEWFVNERRGLEHGFHVFQSPAGDRAEPLVLEMSIDGALSINVNADRRGLVFRLPGDRADLHYDKLLVQDAAGRELPAWFELSGNLLRIVTDDRDAAYPIVIDPLVTMPAWSAEANQDQAGFGTALASGDVNNDGYSDLLIGAGLYDNPDPFINPHPNEGAVFLFMGSASGPALTPVWTAEADHEAAEFGVSVALADVNGDGNDDVLIGASDYDDLSHPDEGWVFLFFGGALAGQATALDADWTAQSNQAMAEFGTQVASAGFVNNDPYEDIIIGASDYTFDQDREGAAFVYYGSINGPNNGVAGDPTNADWTGQGDDVTTTYGSAVASAGDIDNNNYDDIIVGAKDWESSFSNEGRVFLYRAQPNGSGLQTTATWILDGGRNDARLGVSVASAGDVNGDGFDDVLIGADDYSDGQQYEGAAFLFNGIATGLLGTTPAWKGQVDQQEAFFGFSVAGVGDVNNDGFDDVIVGADGYDDPEVGEGAAFLFLGSPNGLPAQPTVTYELDLEDTAFGEAVAAAGDVDGDGYDDVLIGAELYSKVEIDEGGAFLFYGCEDSDRDGVCEAADNCSDVFNALQTDTDGDGIGDVCDPCQDVDNDDVCDEPKVLVESSGPGEELLVQFGSIMRYYANITTLNPGFDSTWMTQSFNDLPWTLGQYGVGYETDGGVGAGNLILSDTGSGKISVYTRSNFVIEDPADVQSMWLGVDYDDAYVAWINGTEVFRSGEMPAGQPAFDTGATTGHESSNGSVPDYGVLNDISANAIDVLQSGVNVLAIGAWNTAPGSSDLVLVPRLSVNRPTSNTMAYKANDSDPVLGLTWTELGFSDASWTKGNYGIGFDTGSDAEDLINSEVAPTSKSVFTRAKFNIALEAVEGIFLGADYDDGYIAWINGEEVYRSPEMGGTPGDTPAWNENPSLHESSNSNVPDYGTTIDITAPASVSLRNGANVLAVGVWRNDPSGSDDLVVVPRLSINEDFLDNCIGTFNPLQEDLDDDGVGDACDPDIDGDGLLNPDDNCPFVFANPSPDADADMIGDACDSCPDDPGNDEDNDGICVGPGFTAPKTAGNDNCPTVANPDQSNIDEDSLGDACDPDIDNDGEPNETDNCVYEFNDQANVDGDIRGAACDCDDGDPTVWEEPGTIYPLLFVRTDVCFDFLCSESAGGCVDDSECDFDECVGKSCTEGSNMCADDLDCERDVCQNYLCSESLGACGDNTDCNSDVCGSKTCTQGANACVDDTECTADFCANRTCTESLVACTGQADCVGSATDFCIGSCSIGLNSCASDAACTQDVCQGVCTTGLNACVDDSVCTAPQTDICRGTCSIGLNLCVNDTVCAAPQTDLCQGTCSLGANTCGNDSACTVPQTDLCQGSCSVGGNTCVEDTACVAADADSLVWKPPGNLGADAIVFDTLLSTVAADFDVPASCIEIDGLDGRTPVPGDPGVGSVDFYLVRVENDCPAAVGNMGKSSDNVARTGRACP